MATTTMPIPTGFPARGAVAPWWHTTALVAFFLFLAAGGAITQHRARDNGGFATGGQPDLAVLYASLIAAELGLVAFVYRSGLRRTGTSLRDLIGGSWHGARAVGADLLIAAATWTAWKVVAHGLGALMGSGHAAPVSPLLPRTWPEAALWILLSISAGFAEEVVFRGYLQRQLTVYTGRVPLAMLLQVSVFAVAHGYQGVQNCFAIAVYGILFTCVALWRKSLRPGILAHAWTDIASGLLR